MKIRNLIISSIAITVVFTAAPSAHAKRSGGGDGEGHRRKAVELVDAKQYDAAIAEFTKVVEASPGDPGAYRDRGTAYRAAARAAEAVGDAAGAAAKYASSVTDFSKMIELAPKDPAAYAERAQTEDMLRQYESGLTDSNKALELKSDEVLGLKSRGFAEIGLQQWDKAVADFTAVIQKDPNDPLNL